MKKQTKKNPVAIAKGTDVFWDNAGTVGMGLNQNSKLHSVRQSINQKTERSEQDVKKHLNDLILPHFILTLFNTVLLILALIA